ncbi:uncharacterized protein A1O9_10188, partial [Exophiala aquamarina CBS 119918]
IHPNRTMAGRQFGGQLTRLHAEAPAFVPASLPPPASTPPSSPGSQLRSHPPRRGKKPASQPPQPRRGSVSRSSAPDIVTRIHEDISHGVYECAICTNEIGRNSKVWSCRTCWTVFHIGCIKRWSKNEGSSVQRTAGQDEQDVPVGKQWRCPGCNLPKDTTPSS